MVVNAFAEEIVFMGYIFNQLAARRGPAVALRGHPLPPASPATPTRTRCTSPASASLFTLFALAYWLDRANSGR